MGTAADRESAPPTRAQQADARQSGPEERDELDQTYREVLEPPHDSGPHVMSQQGIGPVTAKEWARQRLDTPFHLSR